MRRSILTLGALALLTTTLAPLAEARPTKQTAAAKSARRGLALAQTHCAACHGVTVNSSSPNPEAPAWDDIANRPGTTLSTMRTFLRDSHNYPEAMNFHLTLRRVDDLSHHILSLQRKGYKPGI